MTAITSRRWIKLPPTWPIRPRSQSTTRMTIMVQSMDNPFGSVESSLLVLSRGYLLSKLFRPLSRAIVSARSVTVPQLKFRTPQSITCRSDKEILAFFFARREGIVDLSGNRYPGGDFVTWQFTTPPYDITHFGARHYWPNHADVPGVPQNRSCSGYRRHIEAVGCGIRGAIRLQSLRISEQKRRRMCLAVAGTLS